MLLRNCGVVAITSSLLAVAGCAAGQVKPDAQREELPAPPPADAGVSYDSWTNPLPAPTTVEDARSLRAQIERRAPDARFIRAIDVLHHAIDATPTETAEVRFSDGKWFIVRSGKTLAVLPEWPSFRELFAAVTASASFRKLEKDSSPVPAVLSGPELWTELDAVNAAWASGDRSPAILRRAAHALICIAHEMHDGFGIGDVVWSRAIAFAAAAKAAEVLPAADEALLAHGMGYGIDARAIASALPVDHPVRAFVNDDASALLARAGQPNATAGEQYLAARAAANSLGAAEVLRAARTLVNGRRTPALLHAFLRSELFDVQGAFGADALGEDLRSLSERVPMAPSTSGLTTIIESALAGVKERNELPFDGNAERAVWRANTMTAVLVMVQFRQKQGTYLEHADRLLTMLGTPPPGTMTDIVDWFRNSLGHRSAGEWEEREQRVFHGLPSLGAEAVASYAKRSIDVMPIQPATIAQARAIARRMDSRPSHRLALLQLVERLTYDRGWQKNIAAAVVAATGDVDKRDWLSALIGDWTTLERGIHDPSRTPLERMRAVTTLERAKQLDTDAAARLLNGIWQTTDDDTAVTARLAWWLRGKKRWNDLLFLEQWLDRHRDERTLHAAKMRSILAEALRKLRRGDEAWKVLGPALDFGVGDAMREAAFLKLEEGEIEEARAFEQALVRAYGSAASSLEFRWRSGDYAGAAKRISERPYQWQVDAAWAFVDAFEGRPEKEAAAALGFVPTTLPITLLIIWAENMRGLEHADYAALLVERLDVSNDLGVALRGYVILRAARGAAAADAWFEKQKFTSAAGSILRAYDWGLAEALIDPPAALAKSLNDRIAVARVAALAAERKLSSPAADQLRGLLGPNAKSGGWSVANAILSGGTPGGASPASLALVAAARAEAEGRPWDALAAYQDVIDLGGSQGPDTWWALVRMYRLARQLNPSEAADPNRP